MSTTLENKIESTIKDSFKFTVDMHRLYGPENIRTPHFGLFRSDTGETVGRAVRQGYTPHTLEEVITMAKSAANAFDGDCDIRCGWHDGHFVSLAPSKDYRISIYGEKDNIFPRMIIRAGFNGSPYAGTLGLYRDVCKNLEMIRSAGSAIHARIPHTTSLHLRISDLNTAFTNAANSWNTVGDLCKKMESNEVNFAEFLRQVYPLPEENVSKRTLTSHTKRIEKIFDRLRRERVATNRDPITKDNIVSGWEAFNAVQGYTLWDKSRKQKDLTPFKRAILALGDPAVARAEQLALAV